MASKDRVTDTKRKRGTEADAYAEHPRPKRLAIRTMTSGQSPEIKQGGKQREVRRFKAQNVESYEPENESATDALGMEPQHKEIMEIMERKVEEMIKQKLSQDLVNKVVEEVERRNNLAKRRGCDQSIERKVEQLSLGSENSPSAIQHIQLQLDKEKQYREKVDNLEHMVNTCVSQVESLMSEGSLNEAGLLRGAKSLLSRETEDCERLDGLEHKIEELERSTVKKSKNGEKENDLRRQVKTLQEKVDRLDQINEIIEARQRLDLNNKLELRVCELEQEARESQKISTLLSIGFHVLRHNANVVAGESRGKGFANMPEELVFLARNAHWTVGRISVRLEELERKYYADQPSLSFVRSILRGRPDEHE